MTARPPGSLTLTRDLAVRLRQFSDTFIETGTYLGGGVCAALDGGFTSIYSIEFSEALQVQAYRNVAEFRDALGGDAQFCLITGDSAIELPRVLARVSRPAVIFLDSHHMVGDGEAEQLRGGEGWTHSPIRRELDAIAAAPVRGHLVLVDDIDQCGHPSMDGVRLEEITRRLSAIHPYRFRVERGARADSLLFAFPEGVDL